MRTRPRLGPARQGSLSDREPPRARYLRGVGGGINPRPHRHLPGRRHDPPPLVPAPTPATRRGPTVQTEKQALLLNILYLMSHFVDQFMISLLLTVILR
jgi:hypothetical protein